MPLVPKTEKIRKELNELPFKNPRLYALLSTLERLCAAKFDKNVVLTSIYREGDKGPHGEWRAADVRARHGYWTPTELVEIKMFLRQFFPRSDQRQLERNIPGWSGTLRHHGEGDMEHLHICTEPVEQFRVALGVS